MAKFRLQIMPKKCNLILCTVKLSTYQAAKVNEFHIRVIFDIYLKKVKRKSIRLRPLKHFQSCWLLVPCFLCIFLPMAFGFF